MNKPAKSWRRWPEFDTRVVEWAVDYRAVELGNNG
jgi:hypothetical protein